MKTDNELLSQYPWLGVTTTVEEYIEPTYYDALLKEYVFHGKTDLEQFKTFLEKIQLRSALELGCGNGRCTNIFRESHPMTELELVDLSSQMLAACMNNNKGLTSHQKDSLSFVEQCDRRYDLIFSLWSFSHSVHQWLSKLGLEEGRAYVRTTLKKMLRDNLHKDGRFYLVHFDSQSDEQRILIKQWAKVFPIFANQKRQSPSKQIIDEVLEECQAENMIEYEIEKLVGEPIVYENLDEALKIFMNFHLESYFNNHEDVAEIISELAAYFEQFTENGSIAIKPGCFIYRVRRK